MSINKTIISMLNKYNFQNINSKKVDQLSDYVSLILKYNSLLKLTTDINVDKLIERHIIDSLFLLKAGVISQCETILDIGSGAGFPGIPLAIISEKKVLLIESNEKRSYFLNIVKNNLKLNNIYIINKRCENLAHNLQYRENFDCVITRAFANFEIAMELSFPFSKVNGHIFYFASKNTLKIIKKNFNNIKLFGCNNYNILDYKINNISFYIFYVKKLWKTPNEYPRSHKKLGKMH
jgi:16S rRNA (guanine527-N7)-methyltransferase